MKNSPKFKYAVVAIATVLAVACAEDPLEIPIPDVETEIIENPDYEIIRSMGLHTEGIVELDDQYIVEGDILIDKTDIDSMRLIPATRQARYKNTITGGREESIRVKITSSNVPNAEWRRAIFNAIDIWNAVPNCPVWFHKIEHTILYHDVIVRMSNEYSVAAANLPKNGEPGKGIVINPKIDWYNTTLEQKTYIIVHELGHILGLGHTDYIANYYADPIENSVDSPADNYHIHGTPDIEPNSVMDSHSAGLDRGDASSWWGFTAGDLAAIQSMYGNPIWSSEITGPSNCWTVSRPTYTLNFETNLTGPNVTWYVNNVVRQSGSSLSFTPTSLPLGQVTLKAIISFGGTNRETSKVITVDNPVISGPNYPQLNTSVTYSVSIPHEGVTFSGWTVTSGSYTSTSGLNSRDLTIKFTAATIYTLTANFILPGGGTSFVTKTIDLTPMSPLIIAVSSSTSFVGDDNLEAWVVNSYSSNVSFQWSVTGGASVYYYGAYYIVMRSYARGQVSIRCTAWDGNNLLGQSNTVTVDVYDMAPAAIEEQVEKGQKLRLQKQRNQSLNGI